MIELGIGADVLRAVGWLFWGLFAAGLYFAIRRPKTTVFKVLATLAVLAMFIGPMVPEVLRASERQRKYNVAKALFQERCSSAGEKIHRTVADVDGIALLKLRPKAMNLENQFALDDPYGNDLDGEGYLQSFLWVRRPDEMLTTKIKGPAYDYVVFRREGSEQWVEARLGSRTSNAGELEIDKRDVSQLPRYGVTYEDISTREDRTHWIAGSRLSVVDLQTNEVIAERIGWMFDAGLGSTSGGRSPWPFAARNACPSFPLLHGQYPIQVGQTRRFVEKVLKPREGRT